MKSPPPVKRGKFEYEKDGLKYLHRTRAPPYEIESVVGLKNERPIGRHVAKYIKSKCPRDWWEAQIKHGIKCSRFSIEDMKEILSRELGGLAVSPKVQQMEDSMAKEYQELAKEYTAWGKADETQGKMRKDKLDREQEESRNALTDFS